MTTEFSTRINNVYQKILPTDATKYNYKVQLKLCLLNSLFHLFSAPLSNQHSTNEFFSVSCISETRLKYSITTLTASYHSLEASNPNAFRFWTFRTNTNKFFRAMQHKLKKNPCKSQYMFAKMNLHLINTRQIYSNLPHAPSIQPEHDICIYSSRTATNSTGVANMSNYINFSKRIFGITVFFQCVIYTAERLFILSRKATLKLVKYESFISVGLNQYHFIADERQPI